MALFGSLPRIRFGAAVSSRRTSRIGTGTRTRGIGIRPVRITIMPVVVVVVASTQFLHHKIVFDQTQLGRSWGALCVRTACDRRPERAAVAAAGLGGRVRVEGTISFRAVTMAAPSVSTSFASRAVPVIMLAPSVPTSFGGAAVGVGAESESPSGSNRGSMGMGAGLPEEAEDAKEPLGNSVGFSCNSVDFPVPEASTDVTWARDGIGAIDEAP